MILGVTKGMHKFQPKHIKIYKTWHCLKRTVDGVAWVVIAFAGFLFIKCL